MLLPVPNLPKRLKIASVVAEQCPEYSRNEYLKDVNDYIVLHSEKHNNSLFFERDYYNLDKASDFVFPLKHDSVLQGPLTSLVVDSNLFFLKPYLYKYISDFSMKSTVLFPSHNDSKSLYDFMYKFIREDIFPEFCNRMNKVELMNDSSVIHSIDDSFLYLSLALRFSTCFLKYLKIIYAIEGAHYSKSLTFHAQFPHLKPDAIQSRLASNESERLDYASRLTETVIKTSNFEHLRNDPSATPRYLRDSEALIRFNRDNFYETFGSPEHSEGFTNFSQIVRYEISHVERNNTMFEVIHDIVIA